MSPDATAKAPARPSKLSEEAVKRLPPPPAGNKTHYFSGQVLQGLKAPAGFGVRVTAAGAKAFVLNYRIAGQERRYTIGAWPTHSVILAIKTARELRQEIDRGHDPQAAKEQARSPEPNGKTVGGVLDDFITRYARPKLRGVDAIESAFERHVKPQVGKIVIHELRRSHVAEMLDTIEDEAGPVMADRTRAYFRKALAWYGERDDRFNLGAAIVKVEPRANGDARTRVLSDDEIRAIWPALDGQGTFGALVKMLLLTGQRRSEVAGMARAEIGADGIWAIPAKRYKTKRPHFVPLTKTMLAIIAGQPKGNVVFPSSEGTPFTGFGKAKAALDKAVLKTIRAHDPKAEPMPNWTLHDLRRSAKTLMQRAGVRPDISERVLGHVIVGVSAVYDRHAYLDEKRDALEKLAALVERILNPPADNVAHLDTRRAQAGAV